ncbi:restriction endonuclease subunit S [Neorhizobium sp. DAR64860/K0K1]|uniref:restriction endonuclease subunit S n=1 Tax=Neorhizobium sp. DAR64860/K0K1 TaxID=3421955 RepID=UPI003D292875
MTGVDWIGDLPADWVCRPLKHLARLTTGITPPTDSPENYADDAEGYPWVRPEDLDEKGAPTTASRSLSALGWSLVRPVPAGSSLVCCIGSIGKIGFVAEQVATNQQITAASFYRNQRFMFFALSAARTELEVASTGNVLRILNSERLGKTALPVPPEREARAIAAFLDRETRKIDALVEEQRRLIELLKEQRQALISRAVTKGLDPHARMKPSGVEWLGDVPEHWQVRRLGAIFSEIAEPGDGDMPIFSVSIHHGVSDTELNDEELDRKVSRSDDRSKYKRVQPSDLVYNMMRAWQGGFGSVQAVGMVSPAYVVARPKTVLSTIYIEALLRTPRAVEEMRRRSRGITDFRLRLYWDEFKDMSVALPPPEEQNDITRVMAAADAQAEALMSESSVLVDLLQERRSALIAAAITCKIDVRAVVTNQEDAE